VDDAGRWGPCASANTSPRSSRRGKHLGDNGFLTSSSVVYDDRALLATRRATSCAPRQPRMFFGRDRETGTTSTKRGCFGRSAPRDSRARRKPTPRRLQNRVRRRILALEKRRAPVPWVTSGTHGHDRASVGSRLTRTEADVMPLCSVAQRAALPGVYTEPEATTPTSPLQDPRLRDGDSWGAINGAKISPPARTPAVRLLMTNKPIPMRNAQEHDHFSR